MSQVHESPSTIEAGKFNPEASVIRLIEIPAIRALEDKLLLVTSPRGQLPHTLDGPIHETSVSVFGVTEHDTYFRFPANIDSIDEDSAEWEKIYEASLSHESRFELDKNYTDDEIVEALLKMGVDLRDERGFPLRCTKLLCRQAEAAAKGIAGRLPDRAELKLSQWEKGLAREANSHLAAKRHKMGS